jgi:hypothetical protein
MWPSSFSKERRFYILLLTDRYNHRDVHRTRFSDWSVCRYLLARRGRNGRCLPRAGYKAAARRRSQASARTFEAGRPVPLFQTVLTVNRTRPDRDRRYDVTHDGQRFLIVTPGNRSGAVPVTIVVNWASAFKK